MPLAWSRRFLGICLALWFAVISAAMPSSEFCAMHNGMIMTPSSDVTRDGDMTGMSMMVHHTTAHAHHATTHASQSSAPDNKAPASDCCCSCLRCCCATPAIALPGTPDIAIVHEHVGNAPIAVASNVAVIERQAYALPYATAPPSPALM